MDNARGDTKMKYYIVLYNSLECELNRMQIRAKGSNEPNVSQALEKFARNNVIYPGDVIKIVCDD